VQRLARPLARPALTGALPGALFFLALFAASLLRPAAADYMGVEDTAVTDVIREVFAGRILRQQILVGLAYLGLGAGFGLLAALWWQALAALRGRPLGRFRQAGLALALVVAVHGWFLLRSMATYPQIYAPAYAGPDGAWPGRWLFALATDGVPPFVWPLLAALFTGATLALLGTLGWRRGRAFRPRPLGRRGRVAAGLVGTLLVVAAAAFAVRPAAPNAGTPERPNVLLLAVDSLRGDHVGGEAGPAVTPHIDALARRGVRFRQAFTVVPRTFPAWVTLLTGQYPHRHGVRHMFPARAERTPPTASLAAELRAAGWRTGVISDFAGDIFRRMDLGFADVDAPAFTLASNVALAGLKLHTHLLPYLVDVARGRATPELGGFERLADPEWLTDHALDWVDEGDGRPFFLTLFYSCGHFPFAAPGPWWRRYVDPEYRGRSRFHRESLGRPLEGEARAAEEEHVRGLYRGAIAASDAAIGRLLDELEARGQLANTVVVVTADHGENLFEDGRGVSHGDHLYGLESLRIPLVLAGPGLPGGLLVDAPVRSVDVAPTLRRLTGEAPTGPEDGVDLAPFVAAAATGRPAPEVLPVFVETGLWFVVPETDRLDGRRIVYTEGFEAFRFEPETYEIYVDPAFGDLVVAAKHRMLLLGDRKLLYIPTRAGVRWELYDPVRDPDERRDLAAAEPERLADLQARLSAWILEDPAMRAVGGFLLPVARR
jgi:arylsulfatase A-like enzyme